MSVCSRSISYSLGKWPHDILLRLLVTLTARISGPSKPNSAELAAEHDLLVGTLKPYKAACGSAIALHENQNSQATDLVSCTALRADMMTSMPAHTGSRTPWKAAILALIAAEGWKTHLEDQMGV